MRKPLIALVTAAAVMTLAAPAEAATARKFANCTALKKVYPNGVAKPGYKAKPARVRIYTPKVNAALYQANKKMDRDKDGVACERSR